MRKLFALLAALLLVVVLAQFFFAATGGFSTAPRGESYRPHFALGWVIFGLPVVMTAVAALARMPGRLIWMPALVAGLASAQVGLAKLAEAIGGTGPIVFGLHGVNGLAIPALTGLTAHQAWTSTGPQAVPR